MSTIAKKPSRATRRKAPSGLDEINGKLDEGGAVIKRIEALPTRKTPAARPSVAINWPPLTLPVPEPIPFLGSPEILLAPCRMGFDFDTCCMDCGDDMSLGENMVAIYALRYDDASRPKRELVLMGSALCAICGTKPVVSIHAALVRWVDKQVRSIAEKVPNGKSKLKLDDVASRMDSISLTAVMVLHLSGALSTTYHNGLIQPLSNEVVQEGGAA